MKEEMSKDNKRYWQNLDEIAKTEEYKSLFAMDSNYDDNSIEAVSRRKFLGIMASSMALAGLVACQRPVEHIIPYVAPPEVIIPGVANYYATTMPFGLEAYGLIIESHEGRPTKIEGNPKHPSTMGRSNPFIQASILNLYDPDRSGNVKQNGSDKDWNDFVTFWQGLLPKYKANGGAGLAVISESSSSPTMARLAEQFLKNFPHAKWVTYEPTSDENIYRGIELATGKTHQPVYHFDKADVILSLDSDFVHMEQDNVRNAKRFADGRRINSENDKMNRLYVVESGYSLTGAMADHRLRLPSSHIPHFAGALALELKSQGLQLRDIGLLDKFTNHNFDNDWIRVLARDLINAKGNSLVIGGRKQIPEVHGLLLYINDALGNNWKTVTYREPIDSSLPISSDTETLFHRINNGEIETLAIVGCNPIYNAPSDFEFASAIKKVKHTIHLSPYFEETSKMAEWHINQTHYLENWGDARAIDGTLSIIQPLIAPLFNGHSDIELMRLIADGIDEPGYNLVRETWKEFLSHAQFELEWERVLSDGILVNSQLPSIDPGISPEILGVIQHLASSAVHLGSSNLEVVFTPSPSIYDGRFANNAWLQEAPDTITQISWDNPALISPKTALDLGLKNQEMVRLQLNGRSLDIPIWIQPGMADNSVRLNLGYGRDKLGKVADGVGFNVYPLRTSDATDFALGLSIMPLGESYKLANAQTEPIMNGRPIIREATLDYYRKNPDFAPSMVEVEDNRNLWKEFKYNSGYQWGMAIDLNVCIGCGACVIACQSENNIPVVGKHQVYNSRRMHWIRVDRYFAGDMNNPEMLHQPVPCQQCENATCEQVCPVGATNHNEEGLNLQIYNRCFGTRYCSNNCPYKVRRFNYFNYTGKMPELTKMAQNPDVTIRSRGVMEKCTYCLQRINKAKIKAKAENLVLADGEIIPACAQACPTEAIIFGDILDVNSRVAALKKQNRNYKMLTDYNERPRTSYLAKIWNPNPELESLRKSRI
jgi:Fe-S-cluster-containing dehydrogenase component/anaerobic selenocysteine-containing dehydrogenase